MRSNKDIYVEEQKRIFVGRKREFHVGKREYGRICCEIWNYMKRKKIKLCIPGHNLILEVGAVCL